MIGVPAVTYFDFHLQQLRLAGYSRLSDKRAHQRKYHNIFRNIFLVLFPFYVVQIMIYTHEVIDDLEIAVPSMVTMFTFLPAFAKLAILRAREDRIMALINEFNDPIFNQDLEEHKQILHESAVSAVRILKLFFTVAMLTTLVWTIFPIVDFYSGREASADCWFGFDYHKSPHFPLAVLYVKILLVLIATGNTAMDCLISGVLGQCKTQLTLLRSNFENFHEICEKLSKQRNEDFNKVQETELIQCVIHFQKLFNITAEHEEIFGATVFFQLNISGWIICVVAYRLVSINGVNLETLCMVMFLGLMITEFFLYCHYGNEIKFESELLIDSMYLMDWLDSSLSFKKSMIIMMERYKRCMAPTAMGVIPLSMDTFLKILKSSYTFYAVLKNAQD